MAKISSGEPRGVLIDSVVTRVWVSRFAGVAGRGGRVTQSDSSRWYQMWGGYGGGGDVGVVIVVVAASVW